MRTAHRWNGKNWQARVGRAVFDFRTEKQALAFLDACLADDAYTHPRRIIIQAKILDPRTI